MLEPRLRMTDAIVGCSDFVTEKARASFPHLDDRFHTVFNGVDTERFAPSVAPGAGEPTADPAPDLNALYVGRVSPEKGIHTLIEAWAEVVRVNPGAQLDIFGRVGTVPREYVMEVSDDPLAQELTVYYGPDGAGRYGDHLRSRVAALGLEESVQFHGKIPNADLPARLASADLCVFPSVWEEPFGIPPVEAMAAGVPVVATRSGGIAETVVDGHTGLLVDRGDVAGLARAMSALLADPARRAMMARNGRDRATDVFSYAVVAAQLSALYRDLLMERRPA